MQQLTNNFNHTEKQNIAYTKKFATFTAEVGFTMKVLYHSTSLNIENKMKKT